MSAAFSGLVDWRNLDINASLDSFKPFSFWKSIVNTNKCIGSEKIVWSLTWSNRYQLEVYPKFEFDKENKFLYWILIIHHIPFEHHRYSNPNKPCKFVNCSETLEVITRYIITKEGKIHKILAARQYDWFDLNFIGVHSDVKKGFEEREAEAIELRQALLTVKIPRFPPDDDYLH